MLARIPDLPANVIGIKAIGKVRADDYRDVLEPAVAAGRMSNEKVRLLYVLGPEFDGYSAGAMWEDAKVGLHDAGSFERAAVVTDHEALAEGIRVMGWLLPGEIRTYPTDQLDDATAWVSEAG